MVEKPVKYYSKQEVKLKIEHFCSYQERCHLEVRDKLFSYGLKNDVVNELLEYLVGKRFLNEERFAIAYAGGKFRQKKWGRTKIIRELKSRQISDYCIQKAIKEIDEEEYKLTILKTAEKYLKTLGSSTKFERKQKTLRFLLSKGFEYDQCHAVLGNTDL